MSDEQPTLKIRFNTNDAGSHLSLSCYDIANKLVENMDLTVLDAKWGREPSKWTGPGDWGRPRLTLSDREKGYVDAVRTYDPQSPLLAIIDRIVKR